MRTFPLNRAGNEPALRSLRDSDWAAMAQMSLLADGRTLQQIAEDNSEEMDKVRRAAGEKVKNILGGRVIPEGDPSLADKTPDQIRQMQQEASYSALRDMYLKAGRALTDSPMPTFDPNDPEGLLKAVPQMRVADQVGDHILKEWNIPEITNASPEVKAESDSIRATIEAHNTMPSAVLYAAGYYRSPDFLNGTPENAPHTPLGVAHLNSSASALGYLKDKEAAPQREGMRYRDMGGDTITLQRYQVQIGETIDYIRTGNADSAVPEYVAHARELLDDLRNPLAARENVAARYMNRLTSAERKVPYANAAFRDNLQRVAMLAESRKQAIQDVKDGKLTDPDAFDKLVEKPLQNALKEQTDNPELAAMHKAFNADRDALIASGYSPEGAAKALMRHAYGFDPNQPNPAVDAMVELQGKINAPDTPEQPNPYKENPDFQVGQSRSRDTREREADARHFEEAGVDEKNRLLRNQGYAHLGLTAYAEEYGKYAERQQNPETKEPLSKTLENVKAMAAFTESDRVHPQFLANNAQLAAKAAIGAREIERQLKENPTPETIEALFGRDGFTPEGYTKLMEACDKAVENSAVARKHALDRVREPGMVMPEDEKALAKDYAVKSDPAESKAANLTELSVGVSRGVPEKRADVNAEAAAVKAKADSLATRRETKLEDLAAGLTGSHRAEKLSAVSSAPEAAKNMGQRVPQ